jgi:hypothetical protein
VVVEQFVHPRIVQQMVGVHDDKRREMITDRDIIYTYDKEIPAVALVWVIDGQCLYDLPLAMKHGLIFLESDEVIDISEDYPDHDGITVRFIKNGEVVEDLQTSEYFGSILLSNPQVLSLADYPYGRYVESPNAEFDGEKFIITDRDVTGLLP